MGGCASKPSSGKAVQTKRQGQWVQTGVVSLRDARLKELPASLDDPAVYSRSRTLDVTDNILEALPPFIGGFTALLRLVLSRNQLTGLPAEIQHLTSLKALLLDHNRLASLPEAVLRLPRLEVLNASGNALTYVPDGISQLTLLSQLRLNGNQLVAMPTSLGRCIALAELDVSSNRLQGLPPELGNLKRLTTLSADCNAIRNVPQTILRDCSSLSTFTLHHNPITFSELEETDGYEALEQRRRGKFEKVLSGGAMLGRDGLAEIVSRTART